jgi:putative Holliday junction resolvase
MARILAIDYGQKRVGLAVTDEQQIIATALTTVHVAEIFDFLNDYFNRENVSSVVIGEPKQMNNRPSESVRFVEPFVRKFKKRFRNIPVERFDERFTSAIAKRTMLEAGIKKMDRREKGTVDKISAVLILQSYLEYRNNSTRNI